ncbi:hypothetical protein G6F62_014013 [Rhizopus arrhizus]|nr:hypothetical protein G6F62_014013 [Rhizopus arrhizus]
MAFGDPTLTALINEATAANVDIRIAYEHLRQSRAALGITEADTLPRVGDGASYQLGQNSEAGLADPSGRDGRSSFNLWQTGVDASWELDLWGRVRREVEHVVDPRRDRAQLHPAAWRAEPTSRLEHDAGQRQSQPGVDPPAPA